MEVSPGNFSPSPLRRLLPDHLQDVTVAIGLGVCLFRPHLLPRTFISTQPLDSC